jgi:hypothetical protein
MKYCPISANSGVAKVSGDGGEQRESAPGLSPRIEEVLVRLKGSYQIAGFNMSLGHLSPQSGTRVVSF